MTTRNELDRMMQGLSSGKRCYYCLRPAQCTHHIIEKSRSEYLRWDYNNALPVCLECHNNIHLGHIKPEKSDYLKRNENISLKDYLIKNGLSIQEYMEIRKQELNGRLDNV